MWPKWAWKHMHSSNPINSLSFDEYIIRRTMLLFYISTISQASTCTCNADYVRCYNYICTCCIEINIFFEWCCSVMILDALSVSSQHFIFLKTVYKQGKRKLSIWLWMIEKESSLGRFQTDIHVFKTSLIFVLFVFFWFQN